MVDSDIVGKKLIAAYKAGDIGRLRKLISNVKNVNYRDMCGNREFHYAGFDRHKECVRVLIDHGSDI